MEDLEFGSKQMIKLLLVIKTKKTYKKL